MESFHDEHRVGNDASHYTQLSSSPHSKVLRTGGCSKRRESRILAIPTPDWINVSSGTPKIKLSKRFRMSLLAVESATRQKIVKEEEASKSYLEETLNLYVGAHNNMRHTYFQYQHKFCAMIQKYKAERQELLQRKQSGQLIRDEKTFVLENNVGALKDGAAYSIPLFQASDCLLRIMPWLCEVVKHRDAWVSLQSFLQKTIQAISTDSKKKQRATYLVWPNIKLDSDRYTLQRKSLVDHPSTTSLVRHRKRLWIPANSPKANTQLDYKINVLINQLKQLVE